MIVTGEYLLRVGSLKVNRVYPDLEREARDMRQVINGKIYDTEKATMLAEDEFSHPEDFNYWYEALYRTAKGNYFLYGEGGPMTKYSRYLGNNTTGGGSRITPLTPDEAFTWCQEHRIDAAVIEKLFGDMVEEA